MSTRPSRKSLAYARTVLFKEGYQAPSAANKSKVIQMLERAYHAGWQNAMHQVKTSTKAP